MIVKAMTMRLALRMAEMKLRLVGARRIRECLVGAKLVRVQVLEATLVIILDRVMVPVRELKKSRMVVRRVADMMSMGRRMIRLIVTHQAE